MKMKGWGSINENEWKWMNEMNGINKINEN